MENQRETFHDHQIGCDLRGRGCPGRLRVLQLERQSGGGSTSGGPITYGVLSCFTGRLASLGQAMLQGSQVAVSEINSAGGVLGRKLQLATGDTSCDVADGVTATNQMLTKNVSGVIGPETQEINGIEPILDANHIVDEFQGGDTARDHQSDPYFFRDSPSDSQLGVAMALYGHQQNYTKAVMLFYSDPAAQTFLKPVSDTFTKLGGTILKTIIVTPDQSSYLSQVRAGDRRPPAGDLHSGGPADRGRAVPRVRAAGRGEHPVDRHRRHQRQRLPQGDHLPGRSQRADLGVRDLGHRRGEHRVHQPVQPDLPRARRRPARSRTPTTPTTR